LEYDFVVAPGADPGAVALAFGGAGRVEVGEGGSLLLHTSGGPVEWLKPTLYQEVGGVRRPVEGGYVLKGGGRVGFRVGDYDATRPLVIDPVLVYSTYLGGSNGEELGMSLAVDSSGNAYVAGHTSSSDFWTQSAFQSTNHGPAPNGSELYPYDAFVTKLNSDGTGLIYSTFIGGSGVEFGMSIKVNSAGNAFVAGATSSTNFPVSSIPYQPQRAPGYMDAYALKLSADGSSLVYSTYLGGNGNDYANGIAFDASGYVYVAGEAGSYDFPTKGLVYQSSTGIFSTPDGFVTKLNMDPECLDQIQEHCNRPPGAAFDASDLMLSTYIGGTGTDSFRDLEVDPFGSPYVTGWTNSTNYPSTAGAFQTAKNPNTYMDAVLTRLSADFTTLVFSTYVGGSGQDYGQSLFLDSSGNAFVAGNTSSNDLPATSCTSQAVYRFGLNDGFVGKFSPYGSVGYLTYLGGKNEDLARGIAVDSAGNAYVTGQTQSDDFPATQGSYQPAISGAFVDAFVTKLSPDGKSIPYSTFLGGPGGDDVGRSIALDPAGNIYVTGNARSASFPVTGGALQTTYRGNGTYGQLGDAFVSKLSLVTPNPTDNGPLPFTSAEYKFPAGTDPDILSIRQTEVWARVYRPADLSAGPYPVVLFLHGNHGTCGRYSLTPPAPGQPRIDDSDEYTYSGTCSSPYETVPNHLGYAYLAERLASWGYVVVSINANRGITGNASGEAGDSGLILARGRLVLKHLQRLSEWNASNIAFVKTRAIGTTKNNFTGWLGMKITVGQQDIRVRSLGRYFASGNTGTHTVKIVRASDGSEVGSVPVAMAGGSSSTFRYADLASPVTLTAGASYYVVSQETAGGDNWYDSNTSITTTTALASADGRVSSTDGTTWDASGGLAGKVYIPLDFKYDVPTPSTLGGVSLQGKLDLNNVGLMGHSRGGEGVRAAYNLYRESTPNPWPARILGSAPGFIKAVFEIGPTDGQTGFPPARVFNADNTKWNTLIPMCDGDVWDTEGVWVFDRMMKLTSEATPTQKSTYTVWGANHNFYNTEWQGNDAVGCLGHALLPAEGDGSAAQRQTGVDGLVAFFRANLGPGADASLNRRFNPRYELPATVSDVARIDRGFTPSPRTSYSMVFEDFDNADMTNTSGALNEKSADVTVVHGQIPDHHYAGQSGTADPTGLRAGIISWSSAGSGVYFQSNWRNAGQPGVNVFGYPMLDFRVSRQQSTMNPSGPTNFSVQLVMSDGTLSRPVKLCAYSTLTGPVGGYKPVFNSAGEIVGFAADPRPILQTVRIPVGDFISADVSKIRGVRFSFDETSSGAIYLTNIRFSRL
jgi:hypothetical protein